MRIVACVIPPNNSNKILDLRFCISKVFGRIWQIMCKYAIYVRLEYSLILGSMSVLDQPTTNTKEWLYAKL